MAGRHEGMDKAAIDKVVDDRINRAVEQLEEHVAPILGSYEGFLREELVWIKQEKTRRAALSEPPP